MPRSNNKVLYEEKVFLFYFLRCNDPNCSNGTFKKEQTESDTANEMNFLRKMIEVRADKSSSSNTFTKIQNSFKPIEVNLFLI
jgi:hypothetical protein